MLKIKPLETHNMDLAFTPEEQTFREDIRAWVQENLPADISHKVHNALRLSRDDLQRWAKILGKKGWLGHGWPKAFGGPGWNAVQKHLFKEECALAVTGAFLPDDSGQTRSQVRQWLTGSILGCNTGSPSDSSRLASMARHSVSSGKSLASRPNGSSISSPSASRPKKV